jgi:hypothetical protein
MIKKYQMDKLIIKYMRAMINQMNCFHQEKLRASKILSDKKILKNDVLFCFIFLNKNNLKFIYIHQSNKNKTKMI